MARKPDDECMLTKGLSDYPQDYVYTPWPHEAIDARINGNGRPAVPRHEGDKGKPTHSRVEPQR